MPYPQFIDQIRHESEISQSLWIKVVGMLQQNWCLLELSPVGSIDLIFFNDHGEVFDWLSTLDMQYAQAALHANGFRWMWTYSSFYSVSGMPDLPELSSRSRSRPIYSSGEYWTKLTEAELTERQQSGIPTEYSNNDLYRFIEAQDLRWYSIVEEIAAGRKQTHWMWFIFPQLRELGSSRLSEYFGLVDPREAAKYWDDDVLGSRLRSCITLLLALPADTSAEAVFGKTDSMKLRSCMTLFENVSYERGEISAVLDRYFIGKRCPLTLEIVKRSESARKMRISR